MSVVTAAPVFQAANWGKTTTNYLDVGEAISQSIHKSRALAQMKTEGAWYIESGQRQD